MASCDKTRYQTQRFLARANLACSSPPKYKKYFTGFQRNFPMANYCKASTLTEDKRNASIVTRGRTRLASEASGEWLSTRKQLHMSPTEAVYLRSEGRSGRQEQATTCGHHPLPTLPTSLQGGVWPSQPPAHPRQKIPWMIRWSSSTFDRRTTQSHIHVYHPMQYDIL